MDRRKEEEVLWEKDLEMLADDATWKRIQRNTFTRWANTHINSVNKHIEDLEQDLSDGLRLIALIEVLSGKRINRFNKRPTVRAQKLENVGIVLRFLATEEKIKIVNIDGADLVDSNIKLILGLIWTLILHYSISTPFWEGEEDELDEKGNKKKETPKHRLLRWINNKLPELRINNFTTDWNSGIALAALVDAIAPGLFPDWGDLKKEDALLIARKALYLAEKWLGCPQLITPEDLINPKIDELSVMTYLSNFPNAKIKEDCPIKIFSRSNPNRVRVYNIKDTVCGAQTNFTVETFSAGDGKLEVKVLDPQNKEIPVKSVFNEDRSKTYTCSYTPKVEGQHKVIVIYNGKEVPKSPFTVQVQGVKGDASKVKIEGIKDGQVNKPSQFEVDVSSAGLGQVEVAIIDLADNKPCNIPLRIVPVEEPKTEIETTEETKKQVTTEKKSRRQQEQQPELVKPSQRKASKDEVKPIAAENESPTKFKVEYVPQKAGPHQIQVKFAGENTPNSPFKVNFAPPCDLTKVKASGKGLWSLRVGDTGLFNVFTEGAGQGKLQVYVQDPSGKNIPVEMRRIDLDSKASSQNKSTIQTTQTKDGPVYSDNATGGTYECIYKPDKIGKYNVIIQYGEQEILRSPFEVNVSKAIDSNIIAYGPGLKGGIVNSPSVFTVDTRGDDSTLAFSIEGPSQAKIECKDNNDGSCLTSYLPTAPGEYLIHVLSNGEDIPNSPYVSQVLPRTDYNPELVEVRGKGVQPSGVAKNVPVKFEVDSTKAGIAPTEITVMNCKNLKEVQVKCEKRRRSSVDLAGQKKSLESQTKKSKTMSTIKQDSIEKKEGDIIDCVYQTEDTGKHVVQVNFGGVSVKGSPFIVNVGEIGQPNKVKVFGPGVENGILPKTKTSFTIDARNAGVGEITASVNELKSGKKIPINLINNGDDTYKVEYDVEELSSYRVDVSLDGKSVHNMPVTVRASEPLDTKKIKILKLDNTAYLNTPNTFLVDTKALKEQEIPIQVKCELKSKSGKIQQAKIEKLENGIHLVTFKPTEKGETQLNVLCDNQAVNEKPLSVNVIEGFDEKKISVYGKNLKNGVVNEFNEFTIDTRNAGFANLNLAIEGPEDCEMTCTDNEDGTFLCKYKPEVVGDYKIEVKFGNKEVPNSPFTSKVANKVDFNKIKLSGPGVDSKTPILASVPTHIDINAKDAGKPEVEVQDPEGNKCKVKIEEKGNGIYRVEYTPDEIGKYQVTCNFNSLPVPNCPISMNSVPTGDASKCVLKEKIEKQIKAGKENCVTVNAKDAGKGNVTCKISNLSKPKVQQDVSNKKESISKKDTKSKTTKKVEKVEEEEDETIKVRVKDNKDGTFSVFYKVEEPGEYKMDFKFGGQNIPNGVHSFKVVEEEEEEITTTTTTKKKSGNKTGQGEETTTNSTKTTTKKRTVIKTESYEEETTVTEYRTLELRNLPLPKITHSKKQLKKDENISASLNQLIGICKLPNGEEDKVKIIDNRNNTISVQYEPRMEGEHLLSITTTSDNEHIQGSPFRFYVSNPNSKTVTATGEGLVHGIAGETCTFKVHTKGCGLGGLKISIEGPSKAIIESQDDGDNTITVNYVPPTPGEYRITILFADKPINGSPFMPHITGEGKQRSAISVSGSSEIKLKINETFSKEDILVATIITPSGTEESCYLKRIPETGHLLVSFTPEVSGEHLIIVKKNGQPVFGSPFKINVLPTEVGNASLVKLTGTGHKYGKTMIENTFNIDTRQAGYGAVNLSIEGPSKCEISSTEVEPGLLKITYKTKNPGYYLMNLKFADQHVNGSPFTIEVTGTSEQFQRETQKRQTKTVEEDYQIGSVCKMSFTITQSLSKQKLNAFVTSPNGQRKEATLKPVNQTGSTHIVEFVATEIGEHIIEIIEESTGRNIPGLPMKFQVGKLKQDGGVNALRALGPGLEGGVVGQKGEFNIYTGGAGSGSLSITMEGPGKAVLDIKEREDESNFAAFYLVDKPGEYRLAIKYADQHIPNSPFRIWIMPQQDLAKKIVLEGLQTKNATQNKTLTMRIKLNGVSLNRKTTIKETTTTEEITTKTTTSTKSSQDNELIAKLVSPSGKEEDIFLTEIDENECVLKFKCCQPGPHVVNVRLNGVHVTNSPANFFVRKKTEEKSTKKEEIKTTTSTNISDSTKIIKTDTKTDTKADKKTETKTETKTDTKTDTKTGTKTDTKVDTKVDAKTDTKTDIKNTSNISKTTDTSKSTTTNITETEKTTTITCTKTKVQIVGMTKEIKSGQENTFIVNTQNAPMGKLNVKVDGPYKADIKLGLCDEGYKVSYTVTGPGKYFVQAKYNNEDITGFPYELICDGQTNTKRDLGEVKV